MTLFPKVRRPPGRSPHCLHSLPQTSSRRNSLSQGRGYHRRVQTLWDNPSPRCKTGENTPGPLPPLLPRHRRNLLHRRPRRVAKEVANIRFRVLVLLRFVNFFVRLKKYLTKFGGGGGEHCGLLSVFTSLGVEMERNHLSLNYHIREAKTKP